MKFLTCFYSNKDIFLFHWLSLYEQNKKNYEIPGFACNMLQSTYVHVYNKTENAFSCVVYQVE